MVKKLPDTNERDGGTTFNKSATDIFVINPANTNMRKYADLRYRGSLFPLTSAEHPPTATLFTKRTSRATEINRRYTGDFP
jgi:hypothetical protein